MANLTLKIKVIEQRIVVYIPDLTSEVYQSKNITTINDAMELDRADVEKGEIDISELGHPEVIRSWHIYEDPIDDHYQPI